MVNGHTLAQTLGFISDHMDVEDERRAVAAGGPVVISPDVEPRRWWQRSRR